MNRVPRMLLRLEQICSVCGRNCSDRCANEEAMSKRGLSESNSRYDYCPVCSSIAMKPNDKRWQRKVDRWIAKRESE